MSILQNSVTLASRNALRVAAPHAPAMTLVARWAVGRMAPRASSISTGAATLSSSSSSRLRSQNFRGLSAVSMNSEPLITYSGGQASEGQGGFYGSGGARSKRRDTCKAHPNAVARREDVASLEAVMEQVTKHEDALAQAHDPKVEAELKETITQLMAAPVTRSLLDALEIGGEPVWGLSPSERRLVKEARAKQHLLGA
eukprot:CAMPEP_0197414422 /NCGR_PEP_ID=MMETSP1170-20131217/1133_1 /TAXON_ID=54406 /ORGANISM="Sarcinochrysis sp, Strain CCMP770" /LENGTH=198 /DNA_ID=CAMNT_0042941135 /DNA_START=74 /DNA_END=670 /DNA_ORIENTATION=+